VGRFLGCRRLQQLVVCLAEEVVLATDLLLQVPSPLFNLSAQLRGYRKLVSPPCVLGPRLLVFFLDQPYILGGLPQSSPQQGLPLAKQLLLQQCLLQLLLDALKLLVSPAHRLTDLFLESVVFLLEL
jgi:hypothetical protein